MLECCDYRCKGCPPAHTHTHTQPGYSLSLSTELKVKDSLSLNSALMLNFFSLLLLLPVFTPPAHVLLVLLPCSVLFFFLSNSILLLLLRFQVWFEALSLSRVFFDHIFFPFSLTPSDLVSSSHLSFCLCKIHQAFFFVLQHSSTLHM